MSNGQSPVSPVNLTRIASKSLAGGHAPLPGAGESAKKDADKYRPITEHTVVKRALPALDLTPTVDGPEDEGGAPAPVADAAAELDRQAKWKAGQEAKRAKRAEEKAASLVKQQGLASVLLAKGDLVGAAKALGVSAPELVTLVNNGAMGLKPEEPAAKPLTPEEQRTKDETTFREEMKAFRKEQEDWRSNQAMSSFIERSIRPVLADKDAYEMIHASGAQDIETYAYRYMNQHYYDTSEKDEQGRITKPGEILEAKDVLDAIEANLVEEQTKSLERVKGIKKVAKYFAPAGGAETAQALGEEPPPPTGTSASDSRRRRIAEATAFLAAEEAAEAAPAAEQEPEVPRGNPSAPQVVRPPLPGANLRAIRTGKLTSAEKVARARAEEEEAARNSLARRR